MLKYDLGLELVEGNEALYPMFFKQYVVRRKTDLVSPKVHVAGEVELPRNSLYIYSPRHVEDLGPSNQEPFISNYPDEILLTFDSHYDVVAGKARALPFEERKIIQKYRAGHFKYKYIRNIKSVIKKEKALVVVNTALGQRKWNYIITRFTQFERSYNQLNAVMQIMNRVGEGNTREMFFKIELPESIPTYTKFVEMFKHFKKAFKVNDNGKVEYHQINDQVVNQLKKTGGYWLMDWFAFLIGEREYSLFNQLNESSLARFNFILSKNGKCVIVKPGLLISWLDELNKVTELGDGELDVDTYTTQRVNAVKRILNVMQNLILNSEVKEEELGKQIEESRTTDSEGGSREDHASEEEEYSEEISDEGVDSDSDLFSDILMGNNRSNETQLQVEEPDSVGKDSEDFEKAESWTDEVDDSQFELSESSEFSTAGTLGRDGFQSPEHGIHVALDRIAKTGKLSISQKDFFMRQAEKYKDLAMPNGEPLDEYMVIDEKMLRSLPSKTTAPDMVGMIDDSYRESTVQNFKNGYVEHFLEKDIVRMILGVQQAGVCLTSFDKETFKNVDGEYDVYKLGLLPVDGTQSTRSIRVPRIRPDGTFVVDGKRRTKALQRRDKPVRKMDDYRVGLSSYYGRKLIINRNRKVADDYGLWLSKQVRVQAKAGKFDLHVGGQALSRYELPRGFTILGKRFKSIKKDDITLMFSIEDILKKDPSLENAFSKQNAVIGFKGKKPIYIDDHSNLTVDGKHLNTLEGLLEIETTRAPVDYAQININGYKFPIGVVLSYYFGFDQLLKLMEVEYRSVPGGQRIKLGPDDFPLQFADETLIFNRRDPMVSLVFGGMVRLRNLNLFTRYDMNDPGIWVPVINDPKVKHTHFKEMTNMFDMFIDPITRDELIKDGYPTSFDHLLLEATRLLTYDKHEHEVQILEERIIGYESIAGSIYHQLTTAVRQYRNKPQGAKATIDINPESVMMEAGLLDTAVDMVQEVNPAHEIKEQETLTFGGNNGRNDEAMVRRTRGQLPSYRGIVSEAGKDSGKVGYVTYLTSNPKITDYRGNLDPNRDVGRAGLGSVAMNTLTFMNKDDPKRSN